MSSNTETNPGYSFPDTPEDGYSLSGGEEVFDNWGRL
jgi:hypothetical protein